MMEDQHHTNHDKRKNIMQIYSATAASVVFLSVGAQLAWPSAVLPKLLTGEEPIQLTRDEMWWVFVSEHLGQVLGILVTSPFSQCLGRRSVLISTALPLLIASILLVFGKSFTALIIARALGGAAAAVAVATVPLYIAETTLQPRTRGAALTLPQLMTFIGMLIIWTQASNVDILSCILLAFPVLFFVSFLWAEESPYYLLRRGRSDAAYAALHTLTNSSDAATTVLHNLQDDINNDHPPQSRRLLPQVVADPLNRKALCIVLAAVVLDNFISAGIYVPHPDNFEILTSASLNNDIMLIGLVQVVGALAAPVLLETLGRRWSSLLSAATSVVATSVGVCVLLAAENAFTDAPVAALRTVLAVGAAARALALGALPVVAAAEIPAAHAKGDIAAVAAAAAPLCWFAAAQLRQVLREHEGECYSYALSALSSAFAAWYAATVLPETRGLTLRQVQEELQRKMRKDPENENEGGETNNAGGGSGDIGASGDGGNKNIEVTMEMRNVGVDGAAVSSESSEPRASGADAHISIGSGNAADIPNANNIANIADDKQSSYREGERDAELGNLNDGFTDSDTAASLEENLCKGE